MVKIIMGLKGSGKTKRLVEMVGPYKPVEGWTVRGSHAAAVEAGLGCPVFPIELYLTYEWEQA